MGRSISLDHQQLRRIIEERGLTPCHAFFASFIASLSEAGILNQAVVNFLAKHTAGVLHGYLKAMGFLNLAGAKGVAGFKKLVEDLNNALGIGERVEFREEDNVVEVGIGGDKCRYCPRGVGRAEIPGTACPFPRLIEALARLEGLDAVYRPREVNGRVEPLRREAGLCWIRYEVRR